MPSNPVLGASPAGVYWTAPGSGGTRVLGAALDALPAEPQELATAPGPVVYATDHAVLAGAGFVLRSSIDAPLARGIATAADALGEIEGPAPRCVWTLADKLSWGENEAERTVVLARPTRAASPRRGSRPGARSLGRSSCRA